MNESSHLLSVGAPHQTPPQDIDREDAIQEEIKLQAANKTFYSSLSNAIAFGSAGLTYISMYVNLSLVAENVGKDSIDLGSIYVGPAIGSVIGCASWPVLASVAPGGYSILMCLTGLASVFLTLSATTQLSTVYILYFLLGMFGSCLLTGSFALIRTIQKGEEVCGPWFTTASIFYLTMGLLGVLLNYQLENFTQVCLTIAFVYLVVIVFNIYCQHYSDAGGDKAYMSALYEGLNVSQYTVEIVCGTVLGCLSGGNNAIIAYLETYIEETEVLSNANYASTVYWCAVILGQVLIMLFQMKLTTARLLVIHTLSALSIIFISLFLGIFYTNVAYFWGAIVSLGILLGVSFSISMDLVNRLSKHSDVSTTFIFTFFNVASYLVVYLISAVWEYSTVGAPVLFYGVMVVGGVSMSALIAPSLQFRRQYFDDLL